MLTVGGLPGLEIGGGGQSREGGDRDGLQCSPLLYG